MRLELYLLERVQEVPLDALRPGQYQQVGADHPAGARGVAVVACPKCGTLALVLRNGHEVNWAGEVRPGVTCPSAPECELAANITLDGWIPEAKGAA